MSVEKWDPDIHLPLVCKWLSGWGLEHIVDPDMYPPTGFVVDDCAAGFIYSTNAPSVAYIDNLITDSSANPRIRYSAIGRLTQALLQMADDMGIRLIMGTSNIRGVIRICEARGFKVYDKGYELIARMKGT